MQISSKVSLWMGSWVELSTKLRVSQCSISKYERVASRPNFCEISLPALVLDEDVSVEELQRVVDEDEDEEVVVDQLHHRPLPHRHQLEEARHAARGVLVLVLVDVQVGVVLLVHRHLQHRALLTIASLLSCYRMFYVTFQNWNSPMSDLQTNKISLFPLFVAEDRTFLTLNLPWSRGVKSKSCCKLEI